MATNNNLRFAEKQLTEKQQIRKRQAEIHSAAETGAKAKKPIGAVAVIVAVFLCMGSVLALNAYRNELNYDILTAQKQLVEAESQYVTMQNQLDALASEQGRDANSIGMQEAKISQMRYIDLATENKIELMGEMSVWNKIAAFFSGLFEKD